MNTPEIKMQCPLMTLPSKLQSVAQESIASMEF